MPPDWPADFPDGNDPKLSERLEGKCDALTAADAERHDTLRSFA